jgi:hypothetical protein
MQGSRQALRLVRERGENRSDLFLFTRPHDVDQNQLNFETSFWISDFKRALDNLRFGFRLVLRARGAAASEECGAATGKKRGGRQHGRKNPGHLPLLLPD